MKLDTDMFDVQSNTLVCAVAAHPGHTKELQVQLERGLKII